MFTGIIQTKGTIKSLIKDGKATTIVIEAKDVFANKHIGSSISVDGVCLTITKISGRKAYFNLMNTTLKATKLKTVKEGDTVNLEPSLSFGQGLDGHLVQGHVDTTGKVLHVIPKKSETILQISYPPKSSPLLAKKGSITVNGVSLTISDLTKKYFKVSLVAHTLKVTNLSAIKKGDEVNLEFDAIAKYLKSLLDSKKYGV